MKEPTGTFTDSIIGDTQKRLYGRLPHTTTKNHRNQLNVNTGVESEDGKKDSKEEDYLQ